MMRVASLVCLLAACGSAVEQPREPVAEVPVTTEPRRTLANTDAPYRAPRSKGSFLSAIPFKSVKIQNARVGAEAVKMAAELQLATAGSGRCPSVRDLVDGKKLDPKSKDDPWGNPYRIVCDESDVHAVSNGRDGVDNTADDIRDDATDNDLKRISDL